MAEPTGVEAVAAAALTRSKELLASERAQELRQLDLLAVPDAEALADAREALGAGAPRDAVVAEARRRGRPPGAKNKRTDDFAKWLLQFGPHPGLTLMRVQGMPTEQLAEVEGCKRIEALDRQIRCAEALLPYFEGKKPVAIDMTARGDFRLVLGKIEGAGEAGMGGARELKLLPGIAEPDFEENQGLSADEDGASE
ncbi:MAG TPA: hypothetical protein VGB70_12780 [Allosphingosinicella sp.]|jgi:hypothetical protein